MEGSERTLSEGVSSSSSSSNSHTASSDNAERSGAASNSTAEPQVEEEETEDDEAGHQELIRQMTSVSYEARNDSTGNEENMRLIQEDTWSCIVVILTFWFFVSLTMILGVYGSSNFLLGPNSSILMRPNPFFVQYLKVEELEETSHPPTLYGFYRSPPLDVVTTWSEIHKTFLPARSHEEWVYFLNQGSQMNISYTVKSQGSAPLILVIAQRNEGLSQWLEDPSYPNSTLSWKIINGSGMVKQGIYMSSSYYVAVANLNGEGVEVELDVEVRAFLYNTSGAYYKCSLSHGECNLELSFSKGNIGLLTSPSPAPDIGGYQVYVKLFYGPRWMTYITGVGIMTVVMFAVFQFLNNLECGGGRRVQYRDMQSERTPLLSNKDDDLSSWGSSYDSVSQDDEDLEDSQAIGPQEAKSTKDGEYNTRRLCAICFDAPRDCFFLPCGHCVACFACGTRIAEAAGTCPICRRHMKKVRKIYTV